MESEERRARPGGPRVHPVDDLRRHRPVEEPAAHPPAGEELVELHQQRFACPGMSTQEVMFLLGERRAHAELP